MSQAAAHILTLLPPYQGNQTLVKRRQSTFDIEREINKAHRDYASHYDKSCRQHWKGDVMSTCKDLYNFLHYNVPYKEEPVYMQTVKAPAGIIAEARTYGGDCKHMASYIVGTCEALARKGYPIKAFYRFASYNKGDKTPKHVFAVVVHNGQEIWVDPVPGAGGFNSRSLPPVFVIDKLPPMSSTATIGALYRVSGISDQLRVNGMQQRPEHWTDRGGEIGKRRPKEQRKEHRKQQIQKGKRTVLKYSLYTSRNAFLVLVKLNIFSLATGIWKHAAHDLNSEGWKRLSKKWQELGGNPKNLLQSVKNGVSTYNKLHRGHKINGDIYSTESSQIQGFEDVISGIQYMEDVHGLYYDEIGELSGAPAAAAIIAAAAPILVALSGILKSFKIDTKKTEDAAADAADQVAKDHNEEAAKGEPGKGTVTTDANGNQVLNVDGKTVPGATGHEDSTPGTPATGSGDSVSNKVSEIFRGFTDFVSNHKGIFIGGAIAIAAFIFVPKLLAKAKKGRR